MGPNAPAWREEYNFGLISALLLKGKPGNSSAIAIWARTKREQQAVKLGWGSKRITGKRDKHSIFKTESTLADGSILELHTHAEMVEDMGASNLLRQQQCLGTPSMSSPFTDDFGYLADTPTAREVIDGSYTPPSGMDPYLVELLVATEMLAAPIWALGPLKVDITPAENQYAWNSYSEKTSGKPSCLSFAHYKTASLDPILNCIDTFMISLPLAAGFSPKAWQTITDIKILKKPGFYLVDKMRLIQLMSPEFQINSKIIGKLILAHAERGKVRLAQ